MRPFFSFYGGKWRDALKHYPAPTEPTIIEPFAGSAGYALRYHDRSVVLHEIDPVIFGVWQYLISVTPAEVRALPDVVDGIDGLRVPQEAKWLIGFWLNKGASSPRKTPSRWMRDGTRPGSFWGARVRETIASQVEGIRHWRVLHTPYEGADTASRATWFVDPPYQGAGKHYRFGSSHIDFARLGEWCKALSGQVIVCEGEGADWLPFSPLADIKTTRPGKRAGEVVWISSSSSRV